MSDPPASGHPADLAPAGVQLRPLRWSGGSAIDRRFLGTGRYLLWQTVIVIVWICLNLFAVKLRWDPYPFILLNLAFSHPGRLRSPADPAGPEPAGEPGQRWLEEDRRRPADQGRHRVPACELAALRLAIGEVATRDYLRRELERSANSSTPLQPADRKPGKSVRRTPPNGAKKISG